MTLRLLGQQELKVAHTCSTSFACSSANYENKNNITGNTDMIVEQTKAVDII